MRDFEGIPNKSGVADAVEEGVRDLNPVGRSQESVKTGAEAASEPSHPRDQDPRGPGTQSAAAQPALTFTDKEKEIIAGIRRQSDAKAAAEDILGLDVRPKQIRGRCCLFVGVAQTTYYTGYTWAGAIARLIYLRKKQAAGAPELRKAIAASEPRSPVITGGGL